MKNIVANIFRTLFEKKLLSQKSSDQTYGLKIILWWSSLYQLFGGKFDLTAFFSIEIQLFMEHNFFILSRLGFILKGFVPLSMFSYLIIIIFCF